MSSTLTAMPEEWKEWVLETLDRRDEEMRSEFKKKLAKLVKALADTLVGK